MADDNTKPTPSQPQPVLPSPKPGDEIRKSPIMPSETPGSGLPFGEPKLPTFNGNE